MGIETVLIVLGIAAVVAIVAATMRSRRRAGTAVDPHVGQGTVRPPSETDRH